MDRNVYEAARGKYHNQCMEIEEKGKKANLIPMIL